jgi:probable F420-dependent oxidoreductase
MKLGRLAVWYPPDAVGGAAEIAAFVRNVERLGFATLWYPESIGYESLSIASYMLSQTKRLQIGSSIASIYARDAFTARRGMLSLNRLYGERFILGLGVSHLPIVQGVRGHTYERPVPAMRAYLAALAKGEAGAGGWPVCIAALGPLMLKVAAEMTRGAVTYNVTPRHTAEAAKILGPDKALVVEQKVTLEADPARARALGRADLARYMVLENYRNAWLRMGYGEADLANGGSDAFIDAMVLWGSAAKVKEGLRAHFTAGATQVAIHPVHAAGDAKARDAILAALQDG